MQFCINARKIIKYLYSVNIYIYTVYLSIFIREKSGQVGFNFYSILKIIIKYDIYTIYHNAFKGK